MNHTSGKLARALVHAALFGLSFAAVVFSSSLIAQTGGGGSMQEMLKQKVAAIKASTAQNQSKLHQYMWTETTTITANGREMPPKVSNAFYGPDGKVHKEPVEGSSDSSEQSGRRGRLMKHIMEEKKTEMTDYMQQVGSIIKMYVPPDPQKLQAAFEAKKVSFTAGNDSADLVFKDYALPGDSMAIDFDTASKKIRALHVHTYVGASRDPVTLVVEFESLPDGTSHPSRTTLDAQAKDIEVVTVNSNYHKAG